MLTLQHVEHAYKTLKSNSYGNYGWGLHIGYLEACLVQFNYFETETVDNKHIVKLKTLVKKKWYRAEKKETRDQAILRMTEKLLRDNKLL